MCKYLLRPFHSVTKWNGLNLPGEYQSMRGVERGGPLLIIPDSLHSFSVNDLGFTHTFWQELLTAILYCMFRWMWATQGLKTTICFPGHEGWEILNGIDLTALTNWQGVLHCSKHHDTVTYFEGSFPMCLVCTVCRLSGWEYYCIICCSSVLNHCELHV